MKRPRESVRRWWMDREGNIWINIHSTRCKPITDEEIAEMDRLVDEKMLRGDDRLN